MMPNLDDVSLGEIVRGLADVRDEIRALRTEVVRRDIYEAHRMATQSELARLRSEIDGWTRDRTQTRRQALIAIYTAGLTLVLQLVVTVVGG